MKRIMWVLVFTILFTTLPAYAALGDSEKVIHRITFEEIEPLILERNPTIKTTNNTMENLINSRNSIEDAEEDLNDAIDQISSLINQQRQMVDLLNEVPLPLVGDPTLHITLNQTILYVKGLYSGNIATLEQNRKTLREQLEKLPNQELELDKAILQVKMGNNSVVWGAQNLYFAYNTLERQRKELEQNLKLLDDQIRIMEIQQEMGMITALDVSAIRNQRDQLALGLKTLENQIGNLKGELNLMLGQDFDTELVIEGIPEPDEKKIMQMNYEGDLKVAQRRSYSLELQSYNYEIGDNNLKWAEDSGSRDDRRAAERDFENAAINFNQEHKKVELAFYKIYQEVKDKFNALQAERNNFEYQQQKYDASNLKYEMGMISRMEWEKGKADYDAQINKVETARQDLLKAWTQYEWFLKGMDFGQ